MRDPLDISPEIKSALSRNRPIVALESSLIAHGLPGKTNVETALAVEAAVREAGATPATIGIIDGVVRVGLTADEIGQLGTKQAAKVAIRDVAYTVLRKLDGGTTVSATMRIAAASGIGVVATGGIGGVHRGFVQSLDISADLWELARTPAMVVSAGVKSLVDVPATVEWLETAGVPVYGFETDELPAFYSRRSGISVPRLDDIDEVVEMAKLSSGSFGMRCGMLVAVPIPEADELDVTAQIEQAHQEAREAGVSGKEVTPWILERLNQLTNGKTLEANRSLLLNNARTAASIACALFHDAGSRMGFSV